MAYTLPANAPQVTTPGGRTLAVAAVFDNGLVPVYLVGVFEHLADGWNAIEPFALKLTPDQLVGFMNAHGKIADLCEFLRQVINSILSTILGTDIPVPSGEPTTDTQVFDALTAYFATKSLTVDATGKLMLV